MRIAIPFDKADGTIAPAFAEAVSFKLYNAEGDRIVSDLSIPAFGAGERAMLDTLQAARCDVLICGGITKSARKLVAAAGIAVTPGFGGSADDAAKAFVTGALQHEEGHDCANCTHDCDHHHHHDK